MISDKLNKHLHQYLLLLILLLGAFLRFYHYADWSLSNDELSALNRLHYDNLTDLIVKGVKQQDFHPAGVQLLLYFWTKLFGFSAASVRLPFVLSGVFTIFFSYLIAKNWFNKTAGLFVALTLSISGYCILYSQLARPYSTGLLFCLMMVYFWTQLIFNPNNKKHLFAAAYIITSAACMYNHYFSFLFAAIVGFTGLFFLNKKNTAAYIFSAVIIFISFLPHLSITFYHLSFKGLSWLGKPEPGWLNKYILQSFNDSSWLFYLTIFIFVFFAVKNYKTILFNKFHLISLLWFVIPYLVGLYYSKFFNPILQYSVLIFSFPFLILFFFSYIDNKIDLTKLSLLAIIAIIGLYTLFTPVNFYKKQHFGEFKDIASTIQQWNKEYGKQHLTTAVNINHPYYLQYYLNQDSTCAPINYFLHQGEYDLLKLKQIVDTSSTSCFVYAWTKPIAEETYDIIRTKYPAIIAQKNYSDVSEITLFSKDLNDRKLNEPQPYLYSKNDFENHYTNWAQDSSDIIAPNRNHIFLMDSLHEFGPTFSINLASALLKKAKVSAKVLCTSSFGNAQLVLSIEDKNNKTIFWGSSLFKYFISSNQWEQTFYSITIPELPPDDILVKIYIWNIDHKTFYVDDIEIKLYK